MKRFLVAGFPLSSRTESALGTGAGMIAAIGGGMPGPECGMPGTECGMLGRECGMPGAEGVIPGAVRAGGPWLPNPPER
jgi:hypothetical protein